MRLNDPSETKMSQTLKSQTLLSWHQNVENVKGFLGNVFHFLSPTPNEKRKKNDSISNAGASKFYFESHIKIYLANKPEIRSNYFLQSNFFYSK